MRLILALLTCVAVAAASDSWVQTMVATSGVVPTSIFARGDQVVAWNVAGVWSSADGGRSWVGPAAPTALAGGTAIGVRSAVIAKDATYVLAADGAIWVVGGGALAPAGPHGVGLTVDGTGTAWVQDLSGSVTPLPGGQPKIAGALYVPVQAGVIVQRGTGFALATTAGERPLHLRLEDGPPPAASVARVTAGAGDEWLTTDGHLWKIYGGGKVEEASTRPIEVLSTAWNAEGMHEASRYMDHVGLWRPGKGGRQLHVRTTGIQEDAVAMTLTTNAILVLTPKGIWRVDY